MKKQSVGRHVAPLRHIILSQPVLVLNTTYLEEKQ